MLLKEMKMIDWNEYIDKALTRLPGRKKASTLPQLSLQVPDTKGALIPYEAESVPKRERKAKQRLSFQLFEKMRRRALSWKSYYYYDEYDIPRLAITNDNVTGIHFFERRYLVPNEKIIEAKLHTNDNASIILIDVNDLEHIRRDLFDRLLEGAINFQVYNKTYPIEIWFDNDRGHVKNLFPLGKQKIYIEDGRAFLLRPFRNLGGEGFAALSNRLLAQEGISIDPKNTIESLLIELGNGELLRHYQAALNLYNQQSSMRKSSSHSADDNPPLIITKTRQQASDFHRSDDMTIAKQARHQSISDEAYEKIALAFEKHFAELEEDLFYLSLAALSLDRASVIDSCTIIKDKLYFYVEASFLQDNQLEHFYRFMHRFIAEEDIGVEAEEEEVYSPLEDQAYEERLGEVLVNIRNITTDASYDAYPPIRIQIDRLQPTIESLAKALEDADEMQRHREINDKREILTKRAFEVPNTGTYSAIQGEQASYYEHLLEIQKEVHDIQSQTSYSCYDVALRLAKSSYILVLLHLKQSRGSHEISNQLVELMKNEPTGDIRAFELEFIGTLARLTAEIDKTIKNTTSNRLMKIAGDLKGICTNNGQYIDNEWNEDYVQLVRRDVADFNKQVRENATQKFNQIAQQLDEYIQLIETFISGICVPALLPSQLHESGNGLQTFLIQQLQQYLNMQNLQLHTIPGGEKQLRSLVNELMPAQLETPFEQLEYFFMSNV